MGDAGVVVDLPGSAGGLAVKNHGTHNGTSPTCRGRWFEAPVPDSRSYLFADCVIRRLYNPHVLRHSVGPHVQVENYKAGVSRTDAAVGCLVVFDRGIYVGRLIVATQTVE